VSNITDVERDLKTTRQPTPTTLELLLREFENGGVPAKASRILRDGPIIDLRSLPWEVQASECLQSTFTPSKYQVCQVGVHAADMRSDLRGQPKNVASSAFSESSVQNVLCDNAVEVPMLNLAKSFATRDQHAW
jgi:hypothetical protein